MNISPATHRFLLIIGISWLFWACNSEQNVFILDGDIRFHSLSDTYVELPAVHYKYAEKRQYPISFSNQGSFQIRIPVEREKVIYLRSGNESLPVLASPGKKLTIKSDLREFPIISEAEGFGAELILLYSQFHKEDQQLRAGLQKNRAAFQSGQASNYLAIQKLRMDLAKQYFGDTHFENIMYKSHGDYLISLLENLRYRKNDKDCELDREREEILQKAYNLHFFSYESLRAQRAGIRDFAIAFSQTFGIKNRFEQELGVSLTNHDIRYLAYAELDSIQHLILDHINDIHALAHAQMYLVAEYIGEAPFYFAEEKFRDYLSEFGGFPEYTGFLRKHFERAERVKPGQPILDFQFTNTDGSRQRLSDFNGTLTLLKFRASWCGNCKYQDTYLMDIYEQFQDVGFEIVAVSIEEDKKAWLDDLKNHGKPWVNLYSGGGFINESFLAYRGGAIPHYVLISPNGTIIRNNDFRPSFNLSDILHNWFEGQRLTSAYLQTSEN